MKTTKTFWLMLVAAQAGVGVSPLFAQWSQNAGVGPYTYSDPANWVGGNISGVFSSAPTTGLTVQFTNDFTLTNSVVLGYGTTASVIFQSSSATARTLKLMGNLLITNSQGATVTIGTTNNPLILDLNGAGRSLGGATPNGAANSTMNVYAQIVDSSGNTNGVTLSQNRVFTYLFNTSNSFVGPVSFASYRGGGFSSIKNIGGGPSALGAPTDSTNGTITVVDGASNGSLKYNGSGDASDRPFVWNLTFAGPTVANAYSLQNTGTGKLRLTGPQKMPTALGAEFIINAASNSIQFDGYLNSTNGGNAYLQFTGSGNNQIVLNNPANDFAALEINGSAVLAYNTIANAGSPCSLGTNGTVYLKNGTLQYIGTNAFATNSRTILCAGPANAWNVDNGSTNSLTLNNLAFTNATSTSTNLSGTLTYVAGIRTVGLNTLSASDAGPSGTLSVPAAIADASPTNSLQVVAGGAVGYTVFTGGTLALLNASNTFSGGVQIKYGRTLQVMTLADGNTPCSIGLGTNPPNTFAAITFGSTDSQRGGTLAYIGTNNASCNRQIAVLGSSGSANNFSIQNNSPNNSSLHFSATSPVAFNTPAMSNCAVTLGGSAVANNIFDPIITNAPTGNASLTVNGSYWLLTANSTYASNTVISAGTLALGAGASIAKTPLISIAAGATFDVSAAGITLTGSSPQQTLAGSSTSGTATVNAPSKTVTLNSSALLAFQAAGGVSTTAGKISVAGASANVTLNNNTVTVNVAGAALAAGSYRLLDCTGTLTGSASATPTMTGTALSSGYTATVSTTAGVGGHVDLVVKATPVFSGLSSPSITYGAGSVTLSGTLSGTGGSTTVYPAGGETVSATINGQTVNGAVTNSTGGFLIAYNDASLATDGVGGSPYTITYAYAGNSTQLNAAANNTGTTLTVNQAGSSMSVISSANPSGYLDGVFFTATVPAAAAGSVIFLANGTAFSTNSVAGGSAASATMNTLPRGTNLVTAIYSGDVNYLGSTNTLDQIVTNHPPVPGVAGYTRPAGVALRITVSDLLTNVFDADGDSISLAGISASTNGVTLADSSGYLLYQNTNGVNDQFLYTVTDGHGGTNSGVVNITISTSAVFGQNASVSVSGGAATVSFAGIPGYSYGIQRSTNLTDWATMATTNAPANGLFDYTDNFSDLGAAPPSAYYRLQWNP